MEADTFNEKLAKLESEWVITQIKEHIWQADRVIGAFSSPQETEETPPMTMFIIYQTW